MKELTKEDMLAAGAAFVKKHKRYPSYMDMEAVGITQNALRWNFISVAGFLSELYEQVKEHLLDLSKERPKVKIKAGAKKFVITTAVTGGIVDKGFLASIQHYCKKHSATLIVLPSTVSRTLPTLDGCLRNEVVITDDVSLNDNVFILGIKNNARSADPITGLARVGRRNGTFISASPKQRLKYVPTALDKLPHALMSTGAITTPNYVGNALFVDKSTHMAHYDHVMGAVVLELDKNNTFHFRQIQADEHGSFIDLGQMYSGNKVRTVVPEAIVLGDWHVGSTDPDVVRCTEEMCKVLKPKQLILHDLLDAYCLNPHVLHKSVTRARMADRLNLKSELNLLIEDLEFLETLANKLVVVRSNHDDFLDQYLENAEYVKDPVNYELCLQLALHKLAGKNPLEQYVGKRRNVSWLRMDESYMIAGIECGAHGHKGANGARGSITSMENAYGDVVFGHTHSAQILRGAWNTGTSTYLKLDYNHGSSSWTQTHCIIYNNGMRQLVNIIGGRWCL